VQYLSRRSFYAGLAIICMPLLLNGCPLLPSTAQIQTPSGGGSPGDPAPAPASSLSIVGVNASPIPGAPSTVKTCGFLREVGTVGRRQTQSNCVNGSTAPPAGGEEGGPSPSSGGSTMMEITFYNVASAGTGATSSGLPTSEGSGAYNDPITFATAPTEIPLKALIYVKGLNKYFIHTDDCVSCTTDWASGKYHVDLWLGTDPANCAITWGVLQLPVVLNPSATLPVSSQPMDNGTCFPLPSPLPTS
jgi:3D (Asp-Asp-Asp) domain-containing protein